jgi:hypothetical protein
MPIEADFNPFYITSIYHAQRILILTAGTIAYIFKKRPVHYLRVFLNNRVQIFTDIVSLNPVKYEPL